MKNTVHIDRDFGWFVGGFENNQQHKHYAVQLSIPINGKVILKN
jgi:beta-lactamase class D